MVYVQTKIPSMGALIKSQKTFNLNKIQNIKNILYDNLFLKNEKSKI